MTQIPVNIITKISQATSVLVVVPGSSADSLSAGLAVSGFLKKLEKEVEVLAFGGKARELDFLAGFGGVKHELDAVKSFVIDLSTKKTQVDELSYKKEDERLSIYIKPKKGAFVPDDVSFRSSNFPFDLLIMIGVESLERLGDTYNLNTALFFETPVLNIDFRPSNESYGQYNLINIAATSNSEIVFDLINQFEANFIDDAMATQLLAGIISETDSFQHVRTTPQTFLKASQLVSLGANQQEIISRLYKSKSLGLLKLWGRVLARLKHESDISLVSSSINSNDLTQSQAGADDAERIIPEMVSQLGFAKLFLFLKEESEQATTAYFFTTLPVDGKLILKKFDPKTLANNTLKLAINLPLIEAEKQIIALLKEFIGKYKVTI